MPLSEAEVAAIRAAEERLQDALNDPDPTAWVDCYTDDAIFLGHSRPALAGRDALLAYAARMSPISSLEIEPLDTDGSGDLASVVANVTWEQNGTTIRVRFCSSGAAKQTVAGSWRVRC